MTITQEKPLNKKALTKKDLIDSHISYPDIMPHGLEEYPFTDSRILPIFYEIPDGSKVLDIGCNSGEFMKLLKDKKNCKVMGVDISKQVVDIVIKKGMKAIVADADKLPFKDHSFDVVTLMETLEHFYDPEPYLKEIKRVLKPQGFLLGSCPHKNLERHIWEDGRLHRQYYNELGLKDDLYKVFKQVYLRVLSGTEFSMSFSNMFLQDQPVEMLFKTGGIKTIGWDEQKTKMKDTRVWFGMTQLAGTCYYRMRGFADKMDKYGIEPAYENFNYDGSESQTQWQDRLTYTKPGGGFVWSKWICDTFFGKILDIADISVWQVVSNRFAMTFLKCIRDKFLKPVVTEVDDWILDLPGYNVASNPYKPNSESEWVVMEQLKLSDVLIVSTKFLHDHLRQFFPGKRMYIIPNAIDFDIYDNLKDVVVPGTEKADGVIRIGYTGCGNHIGDLDLIKRPILKLLEEFPNLEFMLPDRYQVGKIKLWPDVEHDRVKFLNRWAMMDKYPHEINQWKMDIGIAPLRDNNFNRAKSNLRWLEYSALKIPTVASCVYPFRHSMEQGKTGLICNSELEWYEALKSLIVDEGKRTDMGKQAYLKVKEDFNLDTVSKRYAEVLKEIKCTEVHLKPKLDTSLATPNIAGGQPPS